MRFQRHALCLFAVLLLASVASGQSTTVPIILTQSWTDTGISLSQGQSVGIVVSGTMDYWSGLGGCSIPWPGYPGCIVTPAGIPWPGPCSGTLTPGLACVSAVGMVGSGTPFEVGLGVAFTAQNSGKLYLGVNDGYFADNTGSWIASITVGQGQLQISTTSFPSGPAGQAYKSPPATATGGTPFTFGGSPYHWSVTNAPFAMDVSYFTGALYGDPLAEGTFTPTLNVTDMAGTTVSKQVSVTFTPAVTPPRHKTQAGRQFDLILSVDYERQALTLQILANTCDLEAALGGLIGEETLNPFCQILSSMADVAAAKAAFYEKQGLDPADPNYTVIATPVAPVPIFPAPYSGWTAAQLACFNILKSEVLTRAQLIGLAQAAVTTINRAEGAYEAGNTYWEQQQVAALNRYNTLAAFQLQVLLTEQAQIPPAFLNSGIPLNAVTFTSDQVRQFELNVAANGLPSDLQQALTAMGVDPDGLATLDTAWSSFDPGSVSTDIAHLYAPSVIPTQQLIASIITRFAAFAPKVEINSSNNTFEMLVPFTQGTGSNGINPATEDVSFSLGSFAVTVPAGSFSVSSKGSYQFSGSINGGTLKAIIKPITAGYQLQVEGSGGLGNLGSLANPLTVAVFVGDDGGTATVSAEIQ
jgi:hypothetical protein